MKREEVLGIFPDATQEQIDNLLNGIGKELNPLKQSLSDLTAGKDEAAAKAAEAQQQAMAYKAALDEANEKLAGSMSAEELLAKREEEAAAKERDFILKSNALDAKSILVSSGYFTEEEIEALVERIVSQDAEATKTFAESIVDTVKKQREAVEQSVKDEMLGQAPKLQGAAGDTAMTKEKFDAMTYAEQQKALADTPNLLEQLTTKE